MAFLYGRAGRLTAQNGGFRPGQFDVAYADGDAGERVPRSRVRAKEWSPQVGFGRIVALHDRSSMLYQIH
jgi:hypothetical protein